SPAIEFARALAIEKSVRDGGPGAGKRQEGDGEMRALDCKRERGSQLVAVKRAVARPVHPTGRQPCPCGQVTARAKVTVTGLVAGKADAARTEILGIARQREATKAEALVGESNRAIRVAIARSNGVAEARDEEIADRNVGGRAAHRLAWHRQVDRHLGWLAVGPPRPPRCAAFRTRPGGGR